MPQRSGSPPQGHPARSQAFVWIESAPAMWALIFACVLVAYVPTLTAGFIWDDSGHVTRPELRSLAGLVRIWFEVGATQQYYPLLHSAFWLEHRLWGDAPLGYHLINILLHATNACLFGTLLRRVAVPGAWFAALLFALHPVMVESVAWVSEQKNTLSTLLYLSAALGYLHFDSERRPRQYALAALLFLLALLTKTVTATLPAALLVLFWWQRGRLSWRRDAVPLVPWFALGLVSGLVTAHFERELIGAEGADFNFSLLDRILIASRSVWFYLGKLAWPADLAFIYPRWDINPAEAWQWAFPLTALLLLAGAVLLARRQTRTPLAVLLLFGGTLFPVLGFFNIYPFVFSFVADHFQYLASLAPFAFAAAALARAAAQWPGWSRLLSAGAGLMLLAALSWSQASIYRDGATLYRATLALNPACWMAQNNLALVLTDAGRPQEAIPHLEQALRLRPRYAIAESNLGDDLTRVGRAAEAVTHLERAIQLQPAYAEAQNNLGVALVALGRTSDAIRAYDEALRLKPDYAVAHRNIGLALAMSGRTADAITHFRRAVQLQPNYAEAELGWALALTLTQRFAEADPHFKRALALAPASPEAHLTYARSLGANGRLGDAVVHFREAVALNPELRDAHLELAQAYQQLGRLDEARAEYEQAQRLDAAR